MIDPDSYPRKFKISGLVTNFKHMKYFIGILGLLFIVLINSCEEKWDEHYNTTPLTVDKNVWEAVKENPDLSMFVQYMQDMSYDTLFATNDNTYTLFAPDNQAFEGFTDTAEVTNAVLDYHISTFFVQSGHIQGKQKIQTFSEKFALLDHSVSGFAFDNIDLNFESPLYTNGKYFTMNQVGFPRPNIYEFYAINNPVLKGYIDSQDSIILDREESRPIGFDEDGNTIYDTVAIIYNEFEEEYFPVREEFRNKTATMVFPKEADYNQALTDMAQAMGSVYNNYSDIPIDWQYDILIPYLLERGVFENMIEKEVFLTPTKKDTVKMKNIVGDSVVIEYEPEEKVLCSNGYVYNYANFVVPDTLYKGSTRFEAESLLEQTGINRYAWKEEVNVVSGVSVKPIREFIEKASNDSILKVQFPATYDGTYSVEFIVDNLFPRKYLMVIGTNMNIGGVYEIYVNDELVRTMDYYQFIQFQGVMPSVTGEFRYIGDKQAFNSFDCFVDNKADYGKTRIKFVYTSEAQFVPLKGLVIDFIEFRPYEF